jgi:hypothetical protein
MSVNVRRKDYEDILSKWQRLRDCYDGRDAVLARGSVYVPELPGVDAVGNQSYRRRGNFYNAVKRTVHGLVGAIFQKAPVVTIPEELKSFLKDVTLTNVTFEMFSLEAGRETMLLGRYGVLVDMSTIEATNNQPYLCGYNGEDIINWRTTRIGGDETLTLVVLRERVQVPKDGDLFESTTLIQYRSCELRLGIYVQQLWREKDGKWVEFGDLIIPMRRGTPLNFIPFTFIGANSATADLADPPLLDLADVNLAHWRNSVDHEYGLHLVALPTPWVSGAKNPTGDSKMKIGPSVVWELDIQGEAGMLEFTGSGLSSILTAMEEKKKQMAVIGARMLEDSPSVAETATAVFLRHGGERASLRTVAHAVEQALTLTLKHAVWWASGTLEKPTDAPTGVELNKEYFTPKATASELVAALQALQAGRISFETWWNILETGGWTPEGVTSADELERIAKLQQPPPAGGPAPQPAGAAT